MTRQPRLSAREREIAWGSLVVLAVLTVDIVVGGPVSHLDSQIRDAIQPRRDSAPWWLSAVAELGDLRFAIPIVAIVALVASQYAWRPWPAAFAVGAFAAVELAVLGLKAAVGRAGPGASAGREGYPGYFPSGHAATATAVVAIALFTLHGLGLLRLPPAAILEVCVAAGAAVGALAGYRAVIGDTHWASDVVGGIVLGTAVIVPAMGLCRHLLGRPSGESPPPRRRRRAGRSDGFSAP
jgi:undecaprenyl-diphosphatase